MPGRRRCNWALWLVLTAMLVAILAGVCVYPVLDNTLKIGRTETSLLIHDDGVTDLERLREVVLQALAVAWFFALGAAVGSFLNVIVYRMPAGKSITGSSRCPYCATSIRFRDNIPVFGWLILRGRCRTCRLPISSRYPIVEFTSGALFVLLLYVEQISGGANLPMGARYPSEGNFLGIIVETKWDLIGLYALHSFLLWTLLGCALIQADGNRVPIKLFVFAAMVGMIALTAWPRELAWKIHFDAEDAVYSWLDVLTESGLGLAIGVVVGCAVGVILASRQSEEQVVWWRRPGLWLPWGLTGVYFGWQATLSVVALTAFIFVQLRMLSRLWPACSRVPPMMCLLVAAILQVCLWRQLAQLPWWPGTTVELPHISLAILAILGMSVLARCADTGGSSGPCDARAVDDG